MYACNVSEMQMQCTNNSSATYRDVGDSVGPSVGLSVGLNVGLRVGDSVGLNEGVCTGEKILSIVRSDGVRASSKASTVRQTVRHVPM